jgi:type IV secretory pathway component VirB8
MAANARGAAMSLAYATELLERQQQTETEVAREWRRTRRSNFWLKVALAFFIALSSVLAFALAATVPNIRFLPVFLWANPNGVVESAITTDGLPQVMSDPLVKLILWNYVRAREEYSYADSDFNHYLVMAMSSRPIAEDYDKWFSGNNPNSWQRLYGDRCIVKVDRTDDDVDFHPSINGSEGTYVFHFNRLFQCRGEPQKVDTWTVGIKFVQNYNQGMKLHDVKSFNPARLVITDYPGATVLSGKPSVTAFPR